MRSWLLLVCGLFGSGVWAQAAQPWEDVAFSAPAAQMALAAAQVKPRKAADVVILLFEEHYRYDDANRLVHTGRIVYRVDSPRGVENAASVARFWQPWRQKQPRIRARVISAAGEEHQLDLATLMDAPARNDVPLVYENSRVYHGPLPAVAVGSIVEHEIVVEDIESYFSAGTVNRIGVGQTVPVMQTRITIEAPNNIPLRYTLRLLPEAKVQESKSAGRTTIVIEQGPLEAIEDVELNLPPDVPLQPQIEFSTAPSWQAVAGAYAAVVEPKIRLQDVDELIEAGPAGESTLQLVTRLVKRLHSEVRYTSLLFGESQLIPQFPADTLQRKFGDCKDKSALLVAMLRRAGVSAHLALLSAGEGQDVSAEYPGLGLFNHAIVYIPGKQDLWIDATAQYTRVGHLPAMDSGRLALVIRDGTSALQRTPLPRSQDNRMAETRELHLAEHGPAKIIVTVEAEGEFENQWRSLIGMPGPEMTRRLLREYAKQDYQADELGEYRLTSPEDFSVPFSLRMELPSSRLVVTGEEQAAIAISADELASRLPWYFHHDGADDEDEDEEEEKKTPRPPRTADVFFQPFLAELNYRIVPPPGFRARPLPRDSEVKLGPATLSRKFVVDGQGVVNATLRFDSGDGLFTVAEAEAARAALKTLREAQSLNLYFEQTAHALLTGGDFRGAMTAYDALKQLHPQEALHRMQKARALLDVGLAEHAQMEALAATELEPQSARAWRMLGWVRQHDAIGRRFGEGYDLEGAIEAYGKAKTLALAGKDDDKELANLAIDIIADLAILYEYDAAGGRYSPAARLDAAIAEYRERKALLEVRRDHMVDNLPYAMFYARHFDEVRENYASTPNPTLAHKALQIAATAALSGAGEAGREAHRLTADEGERSNLLVAASRHLATVRHYPQAADLLAAGAAGQANSAQMLLQTQSLRKTVPFEEALVPVSDPRYPVQRALLSAWQVGAVEGPPMAELVSRWATEDVPVERGVLVRLQANSRMASAPEGSPWANRMLADTILSGSTLIVEGSDAGGYRVHVQSPSGPSPAFFVVREAGKYRVLGLMQDLWPLGRAVLDRLAAQDTEGARQWLDWAREAQPFSTGDDALSGDIFPRFWRKGQKAETEQMKVAAAALLSSSPRADLAVNILLHARQQAQSMREQINLNLALASAFSRLKRWDELRERGAALLEAEPDSETAFSYLISAQSRLDQWQALETQATGRLERLPNDSAAIEVLAFAAEQQGQFDRIRDYFRPLIASAQATPSDHNKFAWYGLLTPPVDHEVLDAGRNAYERSRGGSYAIAHTLACLYAASGKPKEARDLLLQSMRNPDYRGNEKSMWYAFGLIAEGYGDIESAMRYHRRALAAPGEEDLVPSSSEVLAQGRLEALTSAQ